MKSRFAVALLLILFLAIKNFIGTGENSGPVTYKKPEIKNDTQHLGKKLPVTVHPADQQPVTKTAVADFKSSDCFKLLASDPKISEARHNLLQHLQEWDSWMYNSSEITEVKVLVNGSSFFRSLSEAGLLINGGLPYDLEHAKLVLGNQADGDSNAFLFLALAMTKEKLGEPFQRELDKTRGALFFTSYYNHVNISLFNYVKTPQDLVAAIAISENMVQIDWNQVEDFVHRHDLNVYLARQIFTTQLQALNEKNSASLSSIDLNFAKRINATAEYPAEVPELLKSQPLFSEKSDLLNRFIKDKGLSCELSSVNTLVTKFSENIKPFQPDVHYLNKQPELLQYEQPKEAANYGGPTTTD